MLLDSFHFFVCSFRFKKRESKEAEDTTSVFSHESPIFIVTLFCLLGIGGFLFIGGLFIQFVVFRGRKSGKGKAEG